MIIAMIRHGKTAGNLEHKYIGRTDEGLCDTGREALAEQQPRLANLQVQGQPFAPAHIYTSPMKRCTETADLLFPAYPANCRTALDNLRESDFGLFEGKNYEEINGDPELGPVYQKWVDCNCDGQIPGGEHLDDFRDRCREAFAQCLRQSAGKEQIALVAHGGVIMVLLEAFHREHRPFYEYHMNNGACFVCRWDETFPVELEILSREG